MPISGLPENVERRRHAKGLTRERLAVAADTSVSTIVRLEREGKAPSLSILDRIAVVLDTSVDHLLTAPAKKRGR